MLLDILARSLRSYRTGEASHGGAEQPPDSISDLCLPYSDFGYEVHARPTLPPPGSLSLCDSDWPMRTPSLASSAPHFQHGESDVAFAERPPVVANDLPSVLRLFRTRVFWSVNSISFWRDACQLVDTTVSSRERLGSSGGAIIGEENQVVGGGMPHSFIPLSKSVQTSECSHAQRHSSSMISRCVARAHGVLCFSWNVISGMGNSRRISNLIAYHGPSHEKNPRITGGDRSHIPNTWEYAAPLCFPCRASLPDPAPRCPPGLSVHGFTR